MGEFSIEAIAAPGITAPLSVKIGPDQVECRVCPHHCRLRTGQLGRCRVRVGGPGTVEPVPGQALVARSIGPVEEHPLYHFHPGIRTLGVGAVGCSAACAYCQNWELALAPLVDRGWKSRPLFADAEEVVVAARQRGCRAITFTFNEPTIWTEGILPLAQHAREAGLLTILVTNGFATSAVWRYLLPHLDAVKVDLKGPDERSYRDIAGIGLAPVLHTLRILREARIWHEVSTVVVPGHNDTPDAIARQAALIADNSGALTPWHLLRFFPAYKLVRAAPGSLAELRQLRQVARVAGLQYVYVSNSGGAAERSTHCPQCGLQLSVRHPGAVVPLSERCPGCGTLIPGRGLIGAKEAAHGGFDGDDPAHR